MKMNTKIIEARIKDSKLCCLYKDDYSVLCSQKQPECCMALQCEYFF